MILNYDTHNLFRKNQPYKLI